LRSFFTITPSVNIAAGCSEDVEVCFLPFSPGGYQCALILTDDSVGELLYLINGTAQLPLPEEMHVPDNSFSKSHTFRYLVVIFSCLKMLFTLCEYLTLFVWIDDRKKVSK